MIQGFINRLTKGGKPKPHYTNAVYNATLSPRYHKTLSQLHTKFLSAYVRYMFDGAQLAHELKRIKTEGEKQLLNSLKESIKLETPNLCNATGEPHQAALTLTTLQAEEDCNQIITRAKRRSHQFSHLSQSVLADQRNHLLLSKIILMAQKYRQLPVIEELAVFQLGIAPADAFAAKLLEDTEDDGKGDSPDVLCFASLAEGIRNVAISQMNHFFQMRRFENERHENVMNGLSSDQLIEELGLDLSLIIHFDRLCALEVESSDSKGNAAFDPQEDLSFPSGPLLH